MVAIVLLALAATAAILLARHDRDESRPRAREATAVPLREHASGPSGNETKKLTVPMHEGPAPGSAGKAEGRPGAGPAGRPDDRAARSGGATTGDGPVPSSAVGGVHRTETPVRTTLAAIRAGRHAFGSLVVIPAVLVPRFAGGEEGAADYVLALPSDSDLLRRYRDLELSAETTARDFSKYILEEVTPESVEDMLFTADQVDQVFVDLREGTEIREGDGAVAVRLAGPRDRVRGLTSLSAGADPYLGRAKRVHDDTFLGWLHAFSSGTQPVASLDAARTRLEEVGRLRPPDLTAPMPELKPLRARVDTSDAGQLERFNAVVDLWNVEQDRRMLRQRQLVVRDLLGVAATLRREVSDGERDLVATVVRPDPGLARALAGKEGAEPAAFLDEDTIPMQAFVSRHGRAVDLLVTSWPPRAEVRVDGVPQGTSPVLIPNRRADQAVRVSFTRKGHPPLEVTVTPEAHADRPFLVEGVLVPAAKPR